jgi:hypothetical protein
VHDERPDDEAASERAHAHGDGVRDLAWLVEAIERDQARRGDDAPEGPLIAL